MYIDPPQGRVRVWWRRRRLLEPAVGVLEPMLSTELSCRGRPGRSRRPSSGRDRTDATGDAITPARVKQQLVRIPRPRYHAGRGRTVAGVHHRAVCESGGCDNGYWSLLSPPVGVRAYAFDRAINAYHAGVGRAGAGDRHKAEIAFDAAGDGDAVAPARVKQRLGRSPRPRYHAGRGRTVAEVHHRAVCESGGGDDGYWSLLSAYWSLCLRPSHHAGGGRAGAGDRHQAESHLMQLEMQ